MAASTPPTALRILYVDDSAVQLLQVRDALTNAGHQVAITSEIVAAQKLVADRDLVILDWHMPEMNGGVALRALKRSPVADPRTLYYVYTVDASVASDYKQLGFDGVFTDKGSMDALLAQIETTQRFIRLRRYVRNTSKPPEK